MLKKTIVISLISMAAIICMPFGYGIWNEYISISANITFAEPSKEAESASPELAVTDICMSDIQSESGESAPPAIEEVVPDTSGGDRIFAGSDDVTAEEPPAAESEAGADERQPEEGSEIGAGEQYLTEEPGQ